MADIMFYTYCKAYNVNPIDAIHTPISLIKKMLMIQSVASELEKEELDKAQNKMR